MPTGDFKLFSTTPPGIKWESIEYKMGLDVHFRKLRQDAVTPTYAKDGDAGLDLVAMTKEHNPPYTEYGTGIAVEIPEGYVGLLFPRSSITKAAAGVSLKNSVGIIDSGYRGEIKVRFELPAEDCLWDGEDYLSIEDDEIGHVIPTPSVGERIAQLLILPYPRINLIQVDELSNTDRGAGGFGSTGQ